MVISASAYIVLSSPGQAKLASVPSHFSVNGRTFGITYLATNESEWRAGLMNKKITGTTTMLFVFPELDIYPFWMYDTNSSLDIIWLNFSGSVGKVVYLVSGAPSCYLPVGCPDYTPSEPANLVIEAKAGFASANGISVGTTIQFS